MTRTLATLEISQAAYDEIRAKLVEAGYDHALLADRGAAGTGEELIDMNGIALVSATPESASPFLEALEGRKPNILRANLERCSR